MKGAAIDSVPVSIVTWAVATPVSPLQPCSEQGVLSVSSGHCHRGAGTLQWALLGPSGGLEGGIAPSVVQWGCRWVHGLW